MIAVLAGFLATALLGLFGVHPREVERGDRPSERFAPAASVALAAVAIGAAFLFEIATIAHAAREQRPFPDWFAMLPIVALDDRAPLYGHAPIGVTVATCTLVETLGLIAIACVARAATLSRAAAIVAGAVSFVMVAAAFVCPATTSFDMYAYDGSAHVASPYHPAAIAFAGDLAVINNIYGIPIAPSPYGPAWIGVSKAATFAFPTLYVQLLALRALGVLAFVATLGALRTLGVSRVALVIVALNPALIMQYVIDAHNDLFAIALVLWSLALAKRSPAAAVALAIVAGAVKLPFLAIGMLAFARIASGRARFAYAGIVATGGIAVYAIFGGADFAHAVTTTSHLYRGALSDTATNFLHAALAIAALATIVVALRYDRYIPSAAWSFAALAATFFAWYVPWGMPYALLERRWLVPFATSLPGLALLLSTTYAANAVQAYFITATVILAPLATYIALRGPSRRTATVE